MRKLIIIGASGHGKVVADIAIRNGYNDIVFLDDDDTKKECLDFPIVGRCCDAQYLEGDKFIAIGNAKIREELQRKVRAITLIHPSAIIGARVSIGEGTVVMAGAVINSDSAVGKGCIINTSSSVDHDCALEDFVHVSVGAHVCGTVEIGKSTWIGAGAIISNNISVCHDCIIGAGAVVIKSIYKSGTYVGVPARII